MQSLKSVQTPFLIILSFFILLFVYVKLAGPIPFSVNSTQTTKSNFFSVSGRGEVHEIPNTASVSLGVTKTNTTVQAAQDDVNKTSQTIMSDLNKLGIEDKFIKTTNYSVNPNYDFTNGKQRITGYTVTQNLDIQVKKIDSVNTVVDMATKDGANVVGNINFTFDDDSKKALEDKARQMAVADAKTKAESLAKATGIRLGRIVDVTESTDTPQPLPFVRNTADGLQKESAAPTTAITPGEGSVVLTVTISYETL